MAAGLITVRLSRTDASPWGFRLQGGKDFGTPLLIQKVNGGSLAERAGLLVGDAVVKINNTEVFALRHKDAQDVIVRAGNSFEVTIERGPQTTWKPHVAPVGNVPSPGLSYSPQNVTKTSLAHAKPAGQPIGTGHNLAARPFSGASTPQGMVKSIGCKQYNTPVGLYSEETIAETLSAQAEVLAGGVLGVNFKKNEKSYNAASSEVFKMVQEADKEPREPEPEPVTGGGGVVVPPPVSGLRHVSAPETKIPASPQASLPPGQNVCADCERLIVGVFVRIKDKNLHVECFKCATCGTSLKNVGYYNINNKLYCDIHAKLVARQNPPAPNLDPITVPPGSRIPAGANFGPQSPQPGTLAPLPFHAPRVTTSHVNAPRSLHTQSGPKPFGTPAAPQATFSTPSAPFSAPSATFSAPSAPFSSPSAPFSAPNAPYNAPASAVSNLSKTLPGNSKSWPPNQGEQTCPNPTAAPLYIPPEDLLRSENQTSAFKSLRSSEYDSTEHTISEEQLSMDKRMSICSTEVSALSETIDKINPMDTVMEDSDRPMSPIPFKEDVSSSEVKSEMQKSFSQEAASSSQKVETSFDGNVQTIRKTKVQESFESSSRMYSAEIATSSNVVASYESFRSETPELEQIMEKRYASIHQQGRPMTPTTLAMSRRIEAQPARCLTPDLENLMDKPHGTYSPLPPASVVRPLTPSQVVVFPPEFPPLEPIKPKPYPTQLQHARQVVSESIYHEKSDGNVMHSKTEVNQFSQGSFDSASLNKRSSISENARENTSEKRQSIDESSQAKRQSISESTQDQRQSLNENVQGKRQSISEAGQERRQSKSGNFVRQQSISEVQDSQQQSLAETIQEKVNAQISSSQQLVTKTQVEEIIKQELNKIIAKEKMYTGIATTSTGFITDAMTIAPDRPFTPIPPPSIPLPEPIPFPPESDHSPPPPPPEPQYQKPAYTLHTSSCASPMLQALTIAPDRPYSPLPSNVKPYEEPVPEPEPPKPIISMITALTTAPETPYHLLGVESTVTKAGLKTAVQSTTQLVSQSDVQLQQSEPVQKFVQKPTAGAFKPIASDKRQSLTDMKPLPLPVPENLIKQDVPQAPASSFPPVTDELKTAFQTVSSFGSSSKLRSSSMTTSSEKSSVKVEDVSKKLISVSELRSSPSYKLLASEVEQYRPLTPSKLTGQSQSALPYYQQNIGEIPLAHRANSPIPHQIKAPMIHPSPQPLAYKQPTSHYTGNTVQAMKELYTQKVSEQYQSQPVPQPFKQLEKPDQQKEPIKKAISSLGYQPSPLAGKPAIPSEPNIPKAGIVPSNLDKTKQVFKPSIPSVNKTDDKSKVPWTVVREQETANDMPTVPWSKGSSGEVTQVGQSFIKQSIESFDQTSTRQSAEQKFEIRRKESSDKSPYTSQWKKTSVESIPMIITQPMSGQPLPQSKQFGSQPLRPSTLPVVNVPPKPSSSNIPDAGPGGAPKSSIAGTSAPRWGRGLLNPNVGAGARIPLCGQCQRQIRGPFITALGKIWCPEHFVCVNAQCRRPLQDIGFVEENTGLYCEYCFEKFLAPACSKCNGKIKGDCLNAIGKHFHPECFTCAYCGKLFGNSPFFLEDALPYCENDWNELFTTKCFACGFPIEAGDRWVEALNNNYHSQCFNCTMCKKNLEGQSFYAKGGRPFCKTHAR
uniref:PDZ and LIM domain protein Zasp n=1 Tax=Clastoptera arizonana TaxID=38151 RepID=A0A1B6E0B2_9HEMI